MAVKTITVTEDAYCSITRLKKDTESFSDLFVRLGGEHRSIRDICGILKHSPKDSIEFTHRVKEIRKQMGKSMEERCVHP
ncbi:MAG TPA: antitoxin VapB family protein [Candidatus Nanoarchaeia archaeon]|nr:antitoxin VapB family protein [Candidatus Nanoarchaeia archaeon]